MMEGDQWPTTTGASTCLEARSDTAGCSTSALTSAAACRIEGEDTGTACRRIQRASPHPPTKRTTYTTTPTAQIRPSQLTIPFVREPLHSVSLEVVETAKVKRSAGATCGILDPVRPAASRWTGAVCLTNRAGVITANTNADTNVHRATMYWRRAGDLCRQRRQAP